MELDFTKEIIFKTSRSGGKGGQHVNKVETQVEARFTIKASAILSEEEKEFLLQKLETKLTKQVELIVVNKVCTKIYSSTSCSLLAYPVDCYI